VWGRRPAGVEAIGENMAARLFLLPRLSLLAGVVPGVVALSWLSGLPVPAAPMGAAVAFTPPLGTAKTIQVTETVWEAENGPTPGPLRRAGTMTFRIERPGRFWVRWKGNDPSKPISYTVSDGQTMARYAGKRFGSLRSQPTATSEWPFPMMGLLNNMPGPVSALPAVRDGKKILLATRILAASRDEFWFDPKTHLLTRWVEFMTWQGKTSEVTRTDYTGWVLNRPLSPSVFRLPTVSARRK